METKTEILQGMARAFFASAWADAAEESGNSRMLSGAEILDIMPRTVDPAAEHAAQTLYMQMENANGDTIARIFERLCEACRGDGDREHTPENFGHYAAMQAMGHGVGLDDAFGRKARELVKVPYCEFGAHSLARDYFPQQSARIVSYRAQ